RTRLSARDFDPRGSGRSCGEGEATVVERELPVLQTAVERAAHRELPGVRPAGGPVRRGFDRQNERVTPFRVSRRLEDERGPDVEVPVLEEPDLRVGDPNGGDEIERGRGRRPRRR